MNRGINQDESKGKTGSNFANELGVEKETYC